jgi:hypothetical protein
VLSNKKCSLHFKFNFSFEVYEHCVLLNKQSMPYTLVNHTWVYEVLDCHITYVIGVEFHSISFKEKSHFIVIWLNQKNSMFFLWRVSETCESHST